MAKQQIRLTESELQNLIAEAVKQELNEGAWDFLRGMGGKVKTDARNLAKNAMTTAKRKATNISNKIKDNVVTPIKTYADDVYQAGQTASKKSRCTNSY